jgi:putative colanic acid biosynthesis acetyltransferase WcaF
VNTQEEPRKPGDGNLPRVDLSDYSAGDFDRGASALREAAWLIVRAMVFLWNPFPCYAFKRWVLSLFGATVGEGAIVKPGARITFPWKLTLGAHCWIGEEAFILNLDEVRIGESACVSQRAFLCTGNHDYRDPQFALITAPIEIGGGAWVGAGAFVGPGVTLGQGAVLCAWSVANRDLEPDTICQGNPARKVKDRW